MNEREYKLYNAGEFIDRLGVQAGREIRQSISCEEARLAWFSMAKRMYLGNETDSDIPVDFELGVHLAHCQTEECGVLQVAYINELRTSKPADGPRLAVRVASIANQIGFPLDEIA